MQPRGSTVTGAVLDAATRAPIANATVTVGTSSAVTDSNGDYTATNVPTGSQELRAAASGYVRFPSDDAPPFFVTVVPGYHDAERPAARAGNPAAATTTVTSLVAPLPVESV